MAVPYTFGTATAAIPLSNLDSNFATTITLGNTAIQLGNTVTTLNNMTLANVTVSSGNVTLTNVAITTANVTTANIGTAVITGTSTLTGLTASTALALDASKNIASVTNTGTGNNVLATSPTLVTPVLGAASATSVTVDAGAVGTPSITTTGDTNTGIFFPAADTIAFAEGGAEAMRIDSSGAVGVGASSPSTFGRFVVSQPSVSRAGWFHVTATSSTAVPAVSFVKQDNDSTTSQILVDFYINGSLAGQGQINANGANAAAFGAFSDSRLKENIVEIPSQLANIMALRPVEFDYIASEGGGHQIGFVAQEVQAIYPDLVGERADGMLTLSDMNKNDARLIKAIQEQQALITSLTARIAALEAK